MNLGGYKFKLEKCKACGKLIRENWYVRHLKSKCKKGKKAHKHNPDTDLSQT